MAGQATCQLLPMMHALTPLTSWHILSTQIAVRVVGMISIPYQRSMVHQLCPARLRSQLRGVMTSLSRRLCHRRLKLFDDDLSLDSHFLGQEPHPSAQPSSTRLGGKRNNPHQDESLWPRLALLMVSFTDETLAFL